MYLHERRCKGAHVDWLGFSRSGFFLHKYTAECIYMQWHAKSRSAADKVYDSFRKQG